MTVLHFLENIKKYVFPVTVRSPKTPYIPLFCFCLRFQVSGFRLRCQGEIGQPCCAAAHSGQPPCDAGAWWPATLQFWFHRLGVYVCKTY